MNALKLGDADLASPKDGPENNFRLSAPIPISEPPQEDKKIQDILCGIMIRSLAGAQEGSNFIHKQYFPTVKAVDGIMNQAGRSLASGLAKVLQSAEPPSVDFFRSVPLRQTKSWGVYLLTLEKEGKTPRVYIGSGTEKTHGLVNRMCNYGTHHQVAETIRSAIAEGFAITRTGVVG